MSRKKLSKAVHDAITRLCQEGDQFARAGNDQAALEKYTEAWELLPEEKEDWEAATWVLAAFGELFFGKDDEESLRAFNAAVQCPGGLGNPYIHLRIGQIHFGFGNTRAADDNLARAYIMGGEEIFAKEDPKYLSRVQSILLPPADEEEIARRKPRKPPKR
jgi:hypothetical protein